MKNFKLIQLPRFPFVCVVIPIRFHAKQRRQCNYPIHRIFLLLITTDNYCHCACGRVISVIPLDVDGVLQQTGCENDISLCGAAFIFSTTSSSTREGQLPLLGIFGFSCWKRSTFASLLVGYPNVADEAELNNLSLMYIKEEILHKPRRMTANSMT